MVKKLGRKKDHREHMQRNLLTSLVLYEKLNTTKLKAKELSASFDRLITIAKKNDLSAKRKIYSLLFDKKSAAKVFEVLVPRYKNRISGFTSVVMMSARLGDNCAICRIELLDRTSLQVKTKSESTTKTLESTKKTI